MGARVLLAAAVAALAVSVAVAAAALDHEVEFVSFGSAVKLQHVGTGARLHSHEIRYADGSGLQSVTGMRDAHDPNSLWLVKPAHGVPMVEQGMAVMCGATVRLEHINTGANLASNKFRAGLSGKLEVCASGSGEEGGAPDNNFIVICEGKGSSDKWLRKYSVHLQNAATKMYLCTHGKYVYGRPVEGQLEIFATDKLATGCTWKTNEGIFFGAK